MKHQDYRLGYRADLEGLRAVAILLVVAAHAGMPGLHGGFVGVDVFFVLSGFLITGLLLHEIANTGRVSFAAFYVRRLRRLLPALFLMLIVASVAAALLLAPAEQRGQSSAAAMAALWSSNIHFALANEGYFAPSSGTNLFLHTWSLGVEEQFYLVWPALLVWLLAKDGARGIARLKVGMLVVLVTSLASCAFLTYTAPPLAFYMMPLRAWQFAAGALVWLYFNMSHAAPRKLLFPHVLGWAGLALLVMCGISFRSAMSYPGGWAIMPTIGTAIVIAAGCRTAQSTGVTRWLGLPPMQWIGRISYSWYLWHWPVLLLGQAIAGSDAPAYRVTWVVLSLLIAIASYWLVESPIRHQQRWLARPRRAIFGAVVVMFLANALCLHWHNYASDRMLSPAFQRYARAHGDAPLIYAMGCDAWYHNARVHPCTFGPADAPHTVILMGDSHAGQWVPAVREVFDRPGWRLLVLTKSACPMVDEPYFYKRIGKQYTVCTKWREQAVQLIVATRPDVVLLASALADFTKQQWIDGTAKILNRLSPAVRHIYILRDTPHLPFDGPDCLAMHAGRPKWLGLTHVCSAPWRNTQANQVYRWIRAASARYANVRTVDMNGLICPNSRCSSERHDIVVFRDSQHLTRSFAATLGPALAGKLGIRP